ncbi:MAG: hypothetical protein ACJZ7Z_07080 [Myxococcota bacterium]|nr:hypothetical protein [Spirochaeta sp.]RPG07152.1 MAG: hypothetical protein CBC32_010235 [Proteobacteria bacterium TMED72]
MPDERGVTHYNVMPIAPLDDQTLYFDAGGIRIGVEYRLLDDAIAAASSTQEAQGDETGAEVVVEDRGVSLHVYGNEGGEMLECIRFDCFDEDPHYHYIGWAGKTNQMIHIDPIAQGDPLSFALDCIQNRLAPMLRRAGAAGAAQCVEPEQIQTLMPRIAEAAYRARFEHNDESIREAALEGRES